MTVFLYIFYNLNYVFILNYLLLFFFNSVPLLKDLKDEVIAKMADVLEVVSYLLFYFFNKVKKKTVICKARILMRFALILCPFFILKEYFTFSGHILGDDRR